MPKKVHLQIRCDEGLRANLRKVAERDGVPVSVTVRKALNAYINRPAPAMANEAIWIAIAALAANALSPAAIGGFIASLKAYDELDQMAHKPPSNGFAMVTKILEERNLDV